MDLARIFRVHLWPAHGARASLGVCCNYILWHPSFSVYCPVGPNPNPNLKYRVCLPVLFATGHPLSGKQETRKGRKRKFGYMLEKKTLERPNRSLVKVRQEKKKKQKKKSRIGIARRWNRENQKKPVYSPDDFS